MKRESKADTRYRHGVYRTWPLFFWRECNWCGKEFRREWGWHFLAGPWLNGVGRRYPLCRTCAPTIEDAHRYANRGPKMSKRCTVPFSAESGKKE